MDYGRSGNRGGQAFRNWYKDCCERMKWICRQLQNEGMWSDCYMIDFEAHGISKQELNGNWWDVQWIVTIDGAVTECVRVTKVTCFYSCFLYILESKVGGLLVSMVGEVEKLVMGMGIYFLIG